MDSLWLHEFFSSHQALGVDELLQRLRGDPTLRSRWKHAIPARILRVPHLDSGTIQTAITREYPFADSFSFLTPPPEQFESALVPIGDPSDRFVLFVDDALGDTDAYSMLTHAIGHLCLGHLKPGDVTAHWDTLAEIRAGLKARRRWDREVAALLAESSPIEPPAFQLSGLADAWHKLVRGNLDVSETSALTLAHVQSANWIDVSQDLVHQGNLFPHQARGAAEIAVRLKRLNAALLADSVGLGKTRTTATVIRLLRDRGEIKRAAILTPRKLERNWRLELALLGLTADGRHADVKIVNKDGFKRLTPREAARELRDCDLIVIEEAHQDTRNHGNRFHRNLRAAMSLDRRGLLVTATPWNNRRGDIFAMMQPFIRPQLTEPQELFGPFKRGFRAGRKEFEESDDLFHRVYERAVLQRTRRQLREAGDTSVYYASREPFLNAVPYSNRQRDAFKRLLSQVEALKLPYFNPIRYLVSEDDAENRLSNTHRFFLLKRAESSFAAFDSTLEAMASRALALVNELENLKTTEVALERWLRGKYGLGEETDADTAREAPLLQERTTSTRQRRIENLIRRARGDGELLELRKRLLNDGKQDVRLVSDLQKEFRRLFANDPKLNAVIQMIRGHVERGEKVLAVSQFADTAFALYGALRSDPKVRDQGIGLIMSTAKGGESGVQIDGREAKREDVIRRFAPNAWRETERETRHVVRERLEAESPLQVLIGTDTISVGQNLQDARCLVHLDLTWNPMVLEQRIGRLDRPRHAGDTTPITIHYFLNLDLIEAELKLKQRLEARLEATYRDTAFDDEILPGYFELIEHYHQLRLERSTDTGYVLEADTLLEQLATARPREQPAGVVETDRVALDRLLHQFPSPLPPLELAENQLIVTVGASPSSSFQAAAEYELTRFDANDEPIGMPERGMVLAQISSAVSGEQAQDSISIGSLAPVAEAMLLPWHIAPTAAQMPDVTRLLSQLDDALVKDFERYQAQRNAAQQQQRAAAQKARPSWLNQLVLELQNMLLNLADAEYDALLTRHRLTDAQMRAWLDALRAGIDTDDDAAVEKLRGYLGRPRDALRDLRELYDLLLGEEGLDESAAPGEAGTLSQGEAQQLEMDLNRVIARVQARILNLRVNLP